jgi:hypothetical protein
MHITVKNSVVKHNLELLKILLHRAKENQCKAWIEISTGELRSKLPLHGNDKKEWRPIQLKLTTDSKKVLVVVEDCATSDQLFDFKGWSARAQHVLLDTIQTINARLMRLPAGKFEEDFFESFVSAQISLISKSKDEERIIDEAWHPLNRNEAEKVLEKEPKGTYLFRKDEYTVLLEQELFVRFNETVHYCITLTYLDEGGIVHDKTLVQRNGYLVIFNDNPNLQEPHFPSTESIIKNIHPSLNRPLKNLRNDF